MNLVSAHSASSLSDAAARRVVARLRAEGNELAQDTELADEVFQRVELIARLALSRASGTDLVAADELRSDQLGRRRAQAEIHPSASLRAATISFEEVFPLLLGSDESITAGDAIHAAVVLQEVLGDIVLTAAHGYVDQLLARLHSVHAQERRRLSSYLHDTTAQSLASALQRLDTSNESVTTVRAILLDTLRDLRSLAARLRQFVGEQRLDEALERHVLGDIELSPRPSLLQSGVPRRFNELKEEEAFLIARELVRNASKHAHASSVTIALDWQPQQLVLVVRDDGQGFDKGVLGSRMGLLICRERAEAMHASFEVESSDGNGTTASLAIPF